LVFSSQFFFVAAFFCLFSFVFSLPALHFPVDVFSESLFLNNRETFKKKNSLVQFSISRKNILKPLRQKFFFPRQIFARKMKTPPYNSFNDIVEKRLDCMVQTTGKVFLFFLTINDKKKHVEEKNFLWQSNLFCFDQLLPLFFFCIWE